jgi:hypothetical protein
MLAVIGRYPELATKEAPFAQLVEFCCRASRSSGIAAVASAAKVLEIGVRARPRGGSSGRLERPSIGNYILLTFGAWLRTASRRRAISRASRWSAELAEMERACREQDAERARRAAAPVVQTRGALFAHALANMPPRPDVGDFPRVVGIVRPRSSRTRTATTRPSTARRSRTRCRSRPCARPRPSRTSRKSARARSSRSTRGEGPASDERRHPRAIVRAGPQRCGVRLRVRPCSGHASRLAPSARRSARELLRRPTGPLTTPRRPQCAVKRWTIRADRSGSSSICPATAAPEATRAQWPVRGSRAPRRSVPAIDLHATALTVTRSRRAVVVAVINAEAEV